jgi:predicted metal-dependent hydrolase
MSTGSAYLTVAGIDVDVVYKDIKHLHIGVHPPLGRVRVAAPRRLDDDRVRLAVIELLPWIKKQRKQLHDTECQSQREMVTGESHYVWGVRHRLKVLQQPGRAHVEIDGERLVLCVPDGTSAEQRRTLLGHWYRQQLREAVPDLIVKWESVLDVSVSPLAHEEWAE